MHSTQNLRPIRTVKRILDVIYALLVGACICLIVWIAVSPFLLQRHGIPGSSTVPVALGEGDEPILPLTFTAPVPGVEPPIAVEDAHGELRIESVAWDFLIVSNLAKLVTAVGLAYIVYRLRTMPQAILDGKAFGAGAVRAIRRIGYAALILSIARAAAEYSAAAYFLDRLPSVTLPLSLPSPFEAETILASLLILILAEVWSCGAELERDQAFTVRVIMAIRVNLDLMLVKRGVKLSELSDAIGIKLANLSILKTNKARAIRFSTLDAICQELDCQPGDRLECIPVDREDKRSR
jgi:putative transcriptional regulator